jgi:hypothetical protein
VAAVKLLLAFARRASQRPVRCCLIASQTAQALWLNAHAWVPSFVFRPKNDVNVFGHDDISPEKEVAMMARTGPHRLGGAITGWQIPARHDAEAPVFVMAGGMLLPSGQIFGGLLRACGGFGPHSPGGSAQARSDRQAPFNRLPGHRVRRLCLRRTGRQGCLHFLDGTPTTIVLDLDRDEPRLLDWFGLPDLGDGESRWFDLAARGVAIEPEPLCR